MLGEEPGMGVLAVVALVAGLLRGFTGFGGPAFLIAVLTIFYPPIMIVGKVLIVDFAASTFLFHSCFRRIQWKPTLSLVIPSLLVMPAGQWLLVAMDPDVLARGIAVTILLTSLMMLAGWRYRKRPGLVGMVLIGVISGVIFGASYIALVTITAVLLGPWNHVEARTLIVAWAFLVQIWFTFISVYAGTVGSSDLLIAWPAAVLYLAGTWLGSRLFGGVGEAQYRNVALIVLAGLALAGLVR
ncbi:MAG: sulfite exporter TauE/SafE family protein [Gammaproteobacteria bacterium]|nr:sulfite exporter TauE/SafE family protein [Gammaproteobacteria bacterium]